MIMIMKVLVLFCEVTVKSSKTSIIDKQPMSHIHIGYYVADAVCFSG